MNWKQVCTPNELKKGMLVAFSTKDDYNLFELWNEQFTIQQVLPNTEGKIEILIKSKDGELLSIYWDEIDKMWIPSA